MGISIETKQRTISSKGNLNQLRKQGQIPAVVYGKKLPRPVSITLDEKEIGALLRSTPNAVIDVDLPSYGKQPAMITFVQRDALTRKIIHVDLHQIDMNQSIKTNVRIEIIGDSAGVKEGGVLSVVQHEIEIKCLPSNIPDSIAVDVSELQIGENFLVQQLSLPAGVEAVTDAETVIISVLTPQKALTEDEAEASDAEAAAADARSKEANDVEE